jgi:hypothetical protein
LRSPVGCHSDLGEAIRAENILSIATIAAVEKQIFEREGFRVQLAPLTAKVKSLPYYHYSVMAPQRWKISDWKNERLSQYVVLTPGEN